MEKQGFQTEAPFEYLYKSIYRPWSWILSSSTNLLLFAALVSLAYILYKCHRARGKRRVLTYSYRTVEANQPPIQSDDPTKINALVTGGSGMLGREIVRILVENGGYNVNSLDLFIPEEESRNSKVCSYIQVDITNYDDLCIATRGMDVVFHTAAILPTVIGVTNDDFEQVNVQGTENVISACQECEVKRLIYTSSIDVVLGKGATKVENVDEEYPFPNDAMNTYVMSKREAEKAVIAANGDKGLTTCAVRPGGLLELIVSYKIIRQVCIHKKGQSSPIVTCEDVAKVQLQLDKVLIDNPLLAAGRAYNLVTNICEYELAETVAMELNGHHKVENISLFVCTLLTYINEGVYWLTGIAPIHPQMTVMALHFVRLQSHSFSSARAHKDLGWTPSPWKDCVKKIIKEWKETKKDK